MTISIKLPESNKALGTRVFNSNGVEITDVKSIDVKFRVDDAITATLEVFVHDLGDMENVHALLGTKTLEHIVKLHGYKLTRIK